MENKPVKPSVRGLNGRDARFFVHLLKTELPRLKEMQDRHKGAPDAASMVGMEFLSHLLDTHFDTMWGFLADMAGLSSEQLDDAPIWYAPAIIQIISEDQDIGLFFDSCRQVIERFRSMAPKGD